MSSLKRVLSVYILIKSTKSISPGDLPNPILHYSGCGREEPSYICDPYNYIDKDEYEKLDEILDSLREGFQGPKVCDNESIGYEVGVAVIDQMPRIYSPQSYAHTVYANWGVGDATCHNGLLLFLSIEDREMYVVTGSATRKRVSDSRTLYVLDSMKPFLKKKEYGNAVYAGLMKIEGYLLQESEASSGWDIFLTFVVASSIIGYGLYAEYMGARNLRLAREKLEKLENDRDMLSRNVYVADTCPICLEKLIFDEDGTSSETVNISRRISGEENWVVKKVKEFIARIRVRLKWLATKVLDFFKVRHSFTYDAVRTNDVTISSSKAAFAVKCGHIFCESCIKNWFVKSNLCPICRKNLSDVDHPRQDQRADLNQGNRTTPAMERLSNRNTLVRHMRALEDHLWWDSFRYRMTRLNHYYPRYVNQRMVREFSQEPRSTYLTRHHHFIRQQQAMAASRSSSSHTNTRTNFGGGVASGGGGGSW
eukprot:maker-scaffold_24-snap-gene-1.26-mRNA-1 protein AED:0.09 eAED:0.09 QI:47/0.66/0.5/1/1/1/4/0/479